MKTQISVVVVTYRRPRELGLALEALEQQESAPSFEVLVIDNDPQKSGQPVAQSFLSRHPQWRYEASPTNNVSLARNVGAGFARGEWLAFLDDDCVPGRHWLGDAAAVIRDFPGPGLVFGGGYQSISPAPVAPPKLLEKDEYLVEGNLFFFRSEYLSLGGMRRDLGPGAGRFGYHEGSELQDRHRLAWGKAHRRFLTPGLAVRHLEANRISRRWLSFLAGFDAVRAFISSQDPEAGGQWRMSVLKFPLPVLRLIPALLTPESTKRHRRVHRELYRLGEICGEIEQDLSQVGRHLTAWLRRANNRLLTGASITRTMASVPNGKGKSPVSLPVSGPWMAGKVGTTELLALEFSDRYLQPVWPRTANWHRAMRRLHIDSGVFPESRRQFTEFLQTYRAAVRQLDAICLWQADPFLAQYEEAFVQIHCPQAARIRLAALSIELLQEIAGRKWLVISPFTETMGRQAGRLPDIHAGKPWAPRLAGQEKKCDFVRCPTFSYLEPSPFSTWSEGLEKLAESVLGRDFDVALIGAGAWSLPLAARLKEAGRTAVHLGGETQLIFGIKGQRWEGYGIYNEHWVRPSTAETPAGFLQKEQGCYW